MRGLPVPQRAEDFTADPVELFFDLAFVYAFSQLVAHMVHFPTWEGASEGLLLFLILWFAWSTFTWAANAVSGNAREVRAIFLVGTAVSVPMGASVQSAFTSGGGTFAICATVIVFLGIGLQIWTASSLPDTRSEFLTILRYGMPNLLACTLLIIGGYLDEGPRKVLWVIFVLTVVTAVQMAKSGDWVVRAGHFAERHGLIIIIALGEIVVAIGISVVNSLGAESGLPTRTLVGLIAAGIMAALLWWSYFDRLQPGLEHRGEELEGRARSRFAGDVYTMTHIPLVAGIISMAAATEEILLHPKDAVHTEFLVMFVVGFGLFFGGIALAAYIAFRAVAVERATAIVAVALLAVLGKSLGGVTLLMLIDLILVVTLVVEHIRIERPHTNEQVAGREAELAS
jgi:low temperature requirement protein LtrA